MAKTISKSKTILVTGGAGFIGSNFVHYFLKKHPDTHLINFDKLTYCGNLDNLREVEDNSHYEFVKGDICDPDSVMKVMKRADYVIHFAAESHVDNSIKDPFVFTRTNVLGTHVLVEAAKKCGVKRFMHISTDEVFGSISSGSFKETDPPNPSSPYSASKAAAELIVKGFVTTFNFPAIIVRFTNTFGPRQYPEKIIPLFVTNLLEGKKVPLYGDGLHIRTWIYVADVCSAIDFLLQKGNDGEIYNISGQTEITNLELTNRILSLLGKDESSIQHVEDRLAHDRRYALDDSKIRKFGWASTHKFDQSLKETVQWYVDNEWWWKKLKGKSN